MRIKLLYDMSRMRMGISFRQRSAGHVDSSLPLLVQVSYHWPALRMLFRGWLGCLPIVSFGVGFGLGTVGLGSLRRCRDEDSSVRHMCQSGENSRQRHG